VAAGWLPFALCHNPTNNKVYCANIGVPPNGGSVTVIDGATNEVIANVTSGGDYCHTLCCDPTNNKVYCANRWTNNVTVIDGASDSALVTLAVGAAPNAFCYNPRENRVYVANYDSSNISVLRDSGGGIEETSSGGVSAAKPMPTIVRGVLFLPEAAGRKPQAASLLDVSGRKVLDLQPGANDVRALAPGVYFVREVQAQAQAQAVRTVVITR
jgi:YVTN family beta-propeller protein